MAPPSGLTCFVTGTDTGVGKTVLTALLLRHLLETGALGRIQSVEMTVAWLRTAAYYRLASWRGTWAGEGGGILMNQASHDLDLLCYLLGRPAHVCGRVRTTLHAIETEDTAHAILEWEDGALGTLHVSTAEAGRPDRLLIAGTRGSLEIARGALRLQRLEMDLGEFIATNPEPFAAPAVSEAPVALPPGAGDHAAVYRHPVEERAHRMLAHTEV